MELFFNVVIVEGLMVILVWSVKYHITTIHEYNIAFHYIYEGLNHKIDSNSYQQVWISSSLLANWDEDIDVIYNYD